LYLLKQKAQVLINLSLSLPSTFLGFLSNSFSDTFMDICVK
jgi:hypothetical protein